MRKDGKRRRTDDREDKGGKGTGQEESKDDVLDGGQTVM